jgi:hypothetical protein
MLATRKDLHGALARPIRAGVPVAREVATKGLSWLARSLRSTFSRVGRVTETFGFRPHIRTCGIIG